MEPNIILSDSALIRDGSCGNHHYEFFSAGYTYVVDFWIINENPGPGKLWAYEGDKCILSELIQEETYSALWLSAPVQ